MPVPAKRTHLPGPGRHEPGNIDDDIILRQFFIHPPDAFEIDADLVNALLNRHVQRGQRRRPDGSIWRQAVSVLERDDRPLERCVEDLGVISLLIGKVTGALQT